MKRKLKRKIRTEKNFITKFEGYCLNYFRKHLTQEEWYRTELVFDTDNEYVYCEVR